MAMAMSSPLRHLWQYCCTGMAWVLLWTVQIRPEINTAKIWGTPATDCNNEAPPFSEKIIQLWFRFFRLRGWRSTSAVKRNQFHKALWVKARVKLWITPMEDEKPLGMKTSQPYMTPIYIYIHTHMYTYIYICTYTHTWYIYIYILYIYM